MEMVDTRGKRVSERRYYLFMLQHWTVAFNPVLHAGKLTMQYICDCWIRVETSRLNFVRGNQKQNRADLYTGLTDQLSRKSIEDGAILGKCVVLPSTFEGSPRQMYQAYQDAMCLVQRFGRADATRRKIKSSNK